MAGWTILGFGSKVLFEKERNKLGLVSVVIPSYNHASYIKQAVESVLWQTYSELELIVIDDGSTDSSLEYLRSVRDSRFTLIEQPNSGAHNAINRGLSIANGDYLTILNSDDIYHSKRLEHCLPELENGVDLVATWIEVIDKKGKTLGVKEGWRNMLPWPVKSLDRDFPDDDMFKANLLLTNFVSTTSNVMFSRRLYECVGGMRNLRFVHDWDFLLRAARQFRCKLIECPLLKYRIHESNTISSNRAWMLFEICMIYAIHLTPMMMSISKLNGYDYLNDRRLFSLIESINLQGNDRAFWKIQAYLQMCSNDKNAEPEEEIIENNEFRSFMVQKILTN